MIDVTLKVKYGKFSLCTHTFTPYYNDDSMIMSQLLSLTDLDEDFEFESDEERTEYIKNKPYRVFIRS